MKRILIILTVVLTMSTGLFAGNNGIDQRVVDAFQKEFTGASDATWHEEKDVYQVTFTYVDKKITAFYDKKGNLMGVTRYILSSDLPYYLQKELKEFFNEYWITSLLELSNAEGTSYYATLENASGKIIIESKGQNCWEYYKQYRNL